MRPDFHQGARILVVEDSPTQRQELQMVLEDEGFTVAVAENGRLGLDLAKSQPFDLVITDVVMPEMDGFQLCHSLRRDARLADIPVVLLTSLSDAADVVRALEVGANNFVRKPLAPEYLLTRVHSILATEEVRRQSRGAPVSAVRVGGKAFQLRAEQLDRLDGLLTMFDGADLELEDPPPGLDRPLRVLAVDDSATSAALVKHELEARDFLVTVATDGREALALLEQVRVDAVVSDLVMPNLDGLGLCRALRADPRFERLPVVLVSALADPLDLVAGIEAGADRFVRKPCHGPALAGTLRRLVAQRCHDAPEPKAPDVDLVYSGQHYRIGASRLQMLDLLMSSYMSAMQQNEELAQAQAELRRANETLEARVSLRTRQLSRRVRELSCMHSASQLFAQVHVSVDAVIPPFLDVIVKGFDYPGHAAARLALDGREWRTGEWRTGATDLAAGAHLETPVFVAGQRRGSLSVTWPAPVPGDAAGLPSSEERDLLTSLANLLGEHLAMLEEELRRQEAERELHRAVARLEAFWQFSTREDASAPDLYAAAAEQMVRMTASPLGLWATVSDHGAAMGVQALCVAFAGEAKQVPVPGVLPVAPGSVWAQVVRNRTPAIVADPGALELGEGWQLPVSTAIRRLLVVPALEGERVVALAAVADHGAPYDDSDARQLGSFVSAVLTRIKLRSGQEALAKSEALFRGSTEAMMDALGVFRAVRGADGRVDDFAVEYVNPAAQAADGCFDGTYADKMMSELSPMWQSTQLAEAFARVVESSEPFAGDAWACEPADAAAGETCWYDLRAGKLGDGVIVSWRNVTERVRAQAERDAVQANLAQTDRLSSMGLLAAGVAHEINNALNYVTHSTSLLGALVPAVVDQLRRSHAMIASIFGQDELIQAMGGPPLAPERLDSAVEMVAIAQNGVKRIAAIASNLRTFSRSDQNELSLVDLREPLEYATTVAYNEYKYRAELVKEFGDVPAVRASEGKLAQVFLNLIINAAHAIPAGQGPGHQIRIRTWNDGAWVCASISDTGNGIAPEDRDRIFRPFFTTKKSGVGTGLGLSICKNIVESLGGTIEFASEQGRGTTFAVRLPVPAQPDVA